MSQELGKKPKKAGEVEVKRVQNFNTAMVKVLVTWLCLTLCKPMNCSPPGSSVHGILQAGTLELVAVPFQGILLTQGSNLDLLHCRQVVYHLSH